MIKPLHLLYIQHTTGNMKQKCKIKNISAHSKNTYLSSIYFCFKVIVIPPFKNMFH